jgi:hypothetical protein
VDLQHYLLALEIQMELLGILKMGLSFGVVQKIQA